jgi:TonB family protein
MLPRLWLALLIIVAPTSTLGITTATSQSSSKAFEQRERRIAGTLLRAAQFISVAHIGAPPSCEDARPPEPLVTPDPLLTPASEGRRVRISFIIGIDGRVHSPLILESSGIVGDRRILATVRTWRYRPATCNGVPTEIEGKVEFSSR